MDLISQQRLLHLSFTKETAEEIPAAFHPDGITFCPAVLLNFLDESDKLVYYLIMVSLYMMLVCTYVRGVYVMISFEIFI